MMARPKSKRKKDLPKRVKKVHNTETIRLAIESVKTKRYTLRKAAVAFGIPASTLSDKLSGEVPLEPIHFSLLTSEEEGKLKNYLVKMAQAGFGLTSEEVRYTAMSILDMRQPPPQDNPEDNLPSASWVYRFFGRHPQLTVRTPQSLVKEKALVTPAAVANWFEGLKRLINQKDPSLLEDPSRIYNADESGFGFDPLARRVEAFTGSKHVYRVTANKTQVTVLACMSAAGHHINPLIIYPYKRTPNSDLPRGFPGCSYNFSDSGWITPAFFYSWLRDVFVPLTAKVRKPLLLLVDGHASHTTLTESSEICEKNGIILYCLMSHASHLIQPLDQAFYGSVKPAWSKATEQHMAETGHAVNLETFASILRPVWDKCCSLEIARESFECAGIVPFNPDRVLASGKFDPTAVSQPATAVQGGESDHRRVPEITSQSHEILSSSEEEGDAEPQPSTSAECVPDISTPTLPIYGEKAEATRQAEPRASTSAGRVEPSLDPSKILTSTQLKAFKELMDFTMEDISKKEYNTYISALAGTQGQPEDTSFSKFLQLLNNFKQATSTSVPVTPDHTPTKKVCLSVDDALRIHRLAVTNGNRIHRLAVTNGKQITKVTPTLPYRIISADSREAMQKKHLKEKEVTAKLACKQQREGNKKKREMEKELAKKKEQVNRKGRKEEAERRKKEINYKVV